MQGLGLKIDLLDTEDGQAFSLEDTSAPVSEPSTEVEIALEEATATDEEEIVEDLFEDDEDFETDDNQEKLVEEEN